MRKLEVIEYETMPTSHGEVQLVTNHQMPPGWLAYDVEALTRQERAAIRLAGIKAKREGREPRIATALAAAATGKVRTIRCGPGVSDAILDAFAEQHPVTPRADGG